MHLRSTMGYLYGDATVSPLDYNFIAFLRDAVEFGVTVLQACERVAQQKARRADAARTAEAELERLEGFDRAIKLAIENARGPEPAGATGRCASALLALATDRVATESSKLRSSLTEQLAQLDTGVLRERDLCLRALEALLAQHDLPDATSVLTLHAENSAQYSARLTQVAPVGLGATLEVEIPAHHACRSVIRVDRMVERLEIQAPDAGAAKDSRLRSQRLEKLHVAELTVGAQVDRIKLRALAQGGGAGFDLLFRAQTPRVRLLRISESQETLGAAFEPGDGDEAKLLALRDRLVGVVQDLVAGRKRLVEVTVDEEPLGDDPALLVERLMATMAPIVQEIAEHSGSATELVVKRLLDDNRREEIFVKRADLYQKLAPLSPRSRKVFDPLRLDRSEPSEPMRVAPLAEMSASGTCAEGPPSAIMIEADEPPVRVG